MPSAFIRAVRSYPAAPLARRLEHQRYVPPNPLVLRRKPRESPAPTTDRDRPVSTCLPLSPGGVDYIIISAVTAYAESRRVVSEGSCGRAWGGLACRGLPC